MIVCKKLLLCDFGMYIFSSAILKDDGSNKSFGTNEQLLLLGLRTFSLILWPSFYCYDVTRILGYIKKKRLSEVVHLMIILYFLCCLFAVQLIEILINIMLVLLKRAFFPKPSSQFPKHSYKQKFKQSKNGGKTHRGRRDHRKLSTVKLSCQRHFV